MKKKTNKIRNQTKDGDEEECEKFEMKTEIQ